MKKYLKRCEDFVLCGASGNKGEILIDGYPDNYAIYHIVVRGVGKMGALFESGYINLDQYENNFVDTKKYLYSKRIYEPSEPFKMYIFEFSKLSHLPCINDFAIILAASSIVGSASKFSWLLKKDFFTPAIWKSSKTLFAFRSNAFASITLDDS